MSIMKVRFGRLLVSIAISSILSFSGAAPLSAQDYPQTTAYLQELYLYENTIYRTFEGYAREAKIDGEYRLYSLFSALAESKLVHLTLIEAILNELNIGVGALPGTTVETSTTEENVRQFEFLVSQKMPQYYSWMKRRILAENFQGVGTLMSYIRKSTGQYRGLLDRLKPYMRSYNGSPNPVDPRLFDYYVCQICGTVRPTVPLGNCPTCLQSSSYYQKVQLSLPKGFSAPQRKESRVEEAPPIVLPIQ